jgi:hypothetical protein
VTKLIRLTMVFAVLTVVPTWASLDAAKAEPNLEKRSSLALDNAQHALKSAQDAYLAQNDMKQVAASLEEVSASVELAYDSLQQTHKVPSKSPKYFKKAEIETRELLRRLDDLREQMSVDDREPLDKARATVQKVHESLLEGIMGGKKKG